MTKSELQKELKEKVKAGVKPSDLKKLKRSKSLGDIPTPPPLPDPPNILLQDQLKEKQKLIEELRKQLETVNQELKETKQELDNSLEARVEAVQQFGKVYDKLQQVRQELDGTIEEASTELISSDGKVSSLRTKLRTAQQTIQQLTNELKWEKIKKGTNLNNSPELPESLNYLRYALYSLLTIWFALLLVKSFQNKNHA